MPTSEFELPIKVYMEDTDAQGIVYHANYLRYFERARSEILMSFGETALAYGPEKLRFVVHEVKLKFSKPAALGDSLMVRTRVELGSPYRLTYHQDVLKPGADAPLVTGVVEVVCVTASGDLREFPSALLARLGLE